MRKIIILFFIIFSNSAFAESLPSFIKTPTSIVGRGELGFLFWNAYTATLYSPSGKYQPGEEFALELKYDMDFTKEEIAQRSIDEMRRSKGKNPLQWKESLLRVIPDVKEGDIILGYKDKNGYSHFFYNGRPTGSIKDTSFTKQFFDIWLGENSSERELREKLLNAN